MINRNLIFQQPSFQSRGLQFKGFDRKQLAYFQPKEDFEKRNYFRLDRNNQLIGFDKKQLALSQKNEDNHHFRTKVNSIKKEKTYDLIKRYMEFRKQYKKSNSNKKVIKITDTTRPGIYAKISIQPSKFYYNRNFIETLPNNLSTSLKYKIKIETDQDHIENKIFLTNKGFKLLKKVKMKVKLDDGTIIYTFKIQFMKTLPDDEINKKFINSTRIYIMNSSNHMIYQSNDIIIHDKVKKNEARFWFFNLQKKKMEESLVSIKSTLLKKRKREDNDDYHNDKPPEKRRKIKYLYLDV